MRYVLLFVETEQFEKDFAEMSQADRDRASAAAYKWMADHADKIRGGAGVSHRQVEDALAVGLAFNTTDRLANAFAFGVLDPEGFDAGARHLLKRGYR